VAKTIGVTSIAPSVLASQQTWFQAVLGQKWETEYRTALSKAEEYNAIVLAAFTGVPWCGPCVKLENEVFESWTFLMWALGKVVLLSTNDSNGFPLEDPLVAQYDITAVPQVVGLNAQGAELGRVVGYGSGMGAKLWIEAFESEVGFG